MTKASVSAITVAEELHAAGFQAVPVLTDRKGKPAFGFQGEKSQWRTVDDWQKFAESNPEYRSVGVRMPQSVVALDVDIYKLPDPEQVWAILQGDAWPPTVRVSARGFDKPSGHYLYRVPEGVDYHTLRGSIPGAGETIRYSHRYSMAPGMWNPDAESHYEWLDERTGVYGVVPVDELPYLPAHMVEFLSKKMAAPAAAGDSERLTARLGIEACWRVKNALARVTWTEGSRHDMANNRVYELLRLDAEGHRGVADALEVLHDSFIDAMEANPRHGESGRDHESEWRRLLVDLDPEEEPDSCKCDESDLAAFEMPTTEDPFWSARPWLHELHEFARGRLGPPWGVLGAFLARASAEIPPWVVLPPYAGTRVGLNLYVALVGKPASGKSVSQGLASEMHPLFSHMPYEWTHRTGGLGSGEGVAKMFGSIKIEKDPTTGEKSEHMTWHHPRRVLFSTDEISTLEAVAGRQGSTLQPITRSAWMGGVIAVSYAATDKKIDLPAHQYRMTIEVGAQPGRIDWLLNEEDAGTPQRYLWMQAWGNTDPYAPEHALTPVILLPPGIVNNEWGDKHDVTFPDDLRLKIRERRSLQTNEADDTIRQHADLQRMKIAAIFAILDGRLDATWEDWNLACHVVNRSERMLDWLKDEQRARGQVASEAQAIAKAAANDAGQAELIKRAAKRLVTRVESHEAPDHHCTSKCIKSAISRPIPGMSVGELRKAARQEALDLGWLEEYEYTDHSVAPKPVMGMRVGPRWPR